MASNSSSVIKQLLNWLSQNVVFVRVLHYGNSSYVQPIEDIKIFSVFLAQIIYYLHDELGMLLLPCGEGGKDVLS